jgi:hypothetical protein
MPASTIPRRPRWLLILLIVATIAAVCVGIGNLGLMMMSPMIFDAGETNVAWLVFLGIWLFPVLLAVGIIIGWIGFGAGARWAAIFGLAVAGLPMVAATGLLLSLAVD